MNDAPDTTSPVRIECFFDIMCPFAYQTSLWLRDIRDRGLVDVTWRFASLEEFNREPHQKHPWERPWSFGFGMLRVAARLRRETDLGGGNETDLGGGNELVERYYAAAGRWLHEEGRKPHSPAASEEILAELGLDPGLVAEAIDDPTTIDVVRAEHDRLARSGGFGVPTLVFPSGRAWFGPVVVPAPQGDEAAALWDVVAAVERFPHLYELKRVKTTLDLAHIADAFQPYLDGRDWISIERPAP
jgi:2-hydroxychromene-2-carboxylate isomerase